LARIYEIGGIGMNEDEMYDAYMEQEMEEVDAGSGRLMFLNADHE